MLRAIPTTICLLVSGLLPLTQGRAQDVDFKRDIEPIFQSRCVTCHNQLQPSGGLRLDNKTAAMTGGYSGAVILPGNSGQSRLFRLVAGLEKEIVMPMVGERLPAQELALIRAWIEQGAHWPEPGATTRLEAHASDSEEPGESRHWAFVPPTSPALPEVQNSAWVRNPIDTFVLSRLEQEGIQPSPPASRRTLIRRLSLDLIGLPPSPAEVDAFLRDNRLDAYDRLVDRLLDSPHFGEKWAMHWLDVARYADSDGYEKDVIRPHAWRYRHWVIDALNQNMPFDRFTIWQVAGDLLPGSTLEHKVATGFHRNTLTNREGGVDPEEFRVEQVIDRTATVGAAWMGLTVGCARCHDHKFDPISQKEFYELTAFFNTAQEVNLDAPLPGEIGPYLLRRPEYEKKRAALLEEYKVAPIQADWEKNVLEAVENPGVRVNWDVALDTVVKMVDNGVEILRTLASQRTAEDQEALTDHMLEFYWIVTTKERLEELKFKELLQKLQQLHQEYPEVTEAQTIAEDPDPPETRVLIRGDYRQPGIVVEPGTPEVLPPLPAAHEQPTRLSLARWLVSREHPLTARVTVNRLWSWIFGRGLVETTEDFGTRGAQPSHPKLLDWLAGEFMRDWDVKGILKRIVTSATYRQSSDARDDLEDRDPDNRLLARGPRFRLQAELIRDVALTAAGLLSPEIGGPSIQPPQPEGVVNLGFSKVQWEVSQGRERYRRGIYIFFRRSVPYPMLTTFDAPDRLATCTRRNISTTPLQALNLLNDPVFFEAARALAVRVLQEKRELDERIEFMFRICLARDPSPSEAQRLRDFYEEQKQILRDETQSAQELFPARGVDGIDSAQAAVWVAMSRVMLNLDEFITKE
ncbi:MAG: PSD1 and planctomycete cytochrome C domain-containing protein [Acidobacteriota bacterium]